jgi:hypothetical protein
MGSSKSPNWLIERNRPWRPRHRGRYESCFYCGKEVHYRETVKTRGSRLSKRVILCTECALKWFSPIQSDEQEVEDG